MAEHVDRLAHTNYLSCKHRLDHVGWGSCFIFCCCLFLDVQGVKSTALALLGKCCTTELQTALSWGGISQVREGSISVKESHWTVLKTEVTGSAFLFLRKNSHLIKSK